jgi:hypothetical protein
MSIDDSSNADGGGEGGYTGQTSDGAGYTGYSPGPDTNYSSAATPPEAPPAPYDGPSIGPLSEEEYQQGQENMRKYEEEEREKRRFLGLEPDPNEPGPHIEPPEMPEITPGPGTL